MVLDRTGGRGQPAPVAGHWSALEYGCHVRDVFRRFDERLHLMLSETDPLFANWDQDATAVEDDYAGQDPVVVAGSWRRRAHASRTASTR